MLSQKSLADFSDSLPIFGQIFLAQNQPKRKLCSKKLEHMKQIHLFNKGFVIFLKGAPFSDFIETGLWNYIPSGIQIHFPLFWRIFFQLGSNLIK